MLHVVVTMVTAGQDVRALSLSLPVNRLESGATQPVHILRAINMRNARLTLNAKVLTHTLKLHGIAPDHALFERFIESCFLRKQLLIIFDDSKMSDDFDLR